MSFTELIDKNIVDKITKQYDNLNKNDEFECSFMYSKTDSNIDISLETFVKIINYMKYLSSENKMKLISSTELDINYNTKETSYRITLSETSNINSYIKLLNGRSNVAIFKYLLNDAQKNKLITVIEKKKNRDVIDIPALYMRIRTASENKLSNADINNLLKKISLENQIDCHYRLKNRLKLVYEDNKDIDLNIDITDVKSALDINELYTQSKYELELELIPKAKPIKKYLELFYDVAGKILRLIQGTSNIITSSERDLVIHTYMDLLKVTDKINLEGRNPVSLEIKDLLDTLPNKYIVMDKSDGERNFMIINNGMVYFINTLLSVKKSDIVVDNKYNNSIFDGELIYIPQYKKYVFMIFDCLCYMKRDIRTIKSYVDRINTIHEFNKDILGDVQIINNSYDVKSNYEYHTKEIQRYYNKLTTDLKKVTTTFMIKLKYYIVPLGIENNEIYKYSGLLWDMIVYNPETNCPYTLDGLIYQPIEQEYVPSSRSELVEYKWKPQNKNTIDFYIKFKKYNDKIAIVYDSSEEELKEDVIDAPAVLYNIIDLHVGMVFNKGDNKSTEKPILFDPYYDKKYHQVYLTINDGMPYDLSGDAIYDNTVVEFYYNNDATISEKMRWVPLRTRYDKTESVRKYGKKYGNYKNVSYNIWESIMNPILMDNIISLGKSSEYKKTYEYLKSKISKKMPSAVKEEDIYYKIRTELAKPMRSFHNYIKSSLIKEYASPNKSNKKIVLDIACGRGGDIMKYYHSNIESYVGIDIDNNGLINKNGALERYKQLRRNREFPKMTFINADGGALLDYNNQLKALGSMSDMNAKLLEIFKEKNRYDLISCQFAIHYFFKNDMIFSNFIENIKNNIKKGGYLICTTFDGDIISDILNKNTNKETDTKEYVVNYMDDKNENKILFAIESNVELKKGLGTVINFHNAIDFEENEYRPEYLVYKDFIVKEFKERCKLELVKTELFKDIYESKKKYFADYEKNATNNKEKEIYEEINSFYQDNNINDASRKLMSLYRYYVFVAK